MYLGGGRMGLRLPNPIENFFSLTRVIPARVSREIRGASVHFPSIELAIVRLQAKTENYSWFVGPAIARSGAASRLFSMNVSSAAQASSSRI